MTTIDGIRQPGTVLLDALSATLDLLDALSVATGRTPAEVVALLVADMSANLAPRGVAGQGDTRPPAPTNVLTPTARRLGCTEGPDDGEAHRADWAMFAPGKTQWEVGDGDVIGRACCDDHIPEGWVRPDEVPAPAKPSFAAITYVDPDGDTLALVPLEDRPADWAVRITTADPDGELDVFIEDDETLAGFARMLLGAIEDRRR